MASNVVKLSSAPDSRGKWFYDCAECIRGGNGDKSCGSGSKVKKIRQGGCFLGELLPKYKA